MSDKSPKARKQVRPKVVKKSGVGDPMSESYANENKSEIENKRQNPLDHFEITNNSEKSEIEHPIRLKADEIKTMEVHHHPEVEKKGFKEYLLEGLMIFIAVMMGFFAESLREHISERQRSQEYAATLISDLKEDTTELNDYIGYTNYAAKQVDTLMQLLSANDPAQISTGKLYWRGLFGGAHHVFISHDATLMEMKSSGSLRYFADKVINRKLARYDQLCQSVKMTDANESGIYAEVRKARAQIFEFKYNDVVNNIFRVKNLAVRNKMIDSFEKTRPPVLTHDKTLFNQYVEMVRSRFLSVKVANADTLRRRASELIGLLQKKYEPEDE
jgi:hypothetical protein